MKWRDWIAFCSGFFLLLAGCGYQFSGRGLPPDVQAIFVEPFTNRSPAVGVDSELTLALKSELRRQGLVRVTPRLEEADAVLSGVVRALDSRVVSVNRRDEALEYEARLIIDLSLRRRASDELLWRAEGMRLTEIYSASRGAVVTSSSQFARGTLNASDVRRLTDVQLTESLGQETRDELIDRVAKELHERLMDLF